MSTPQIEDFGRAAPSVVAAVVAVDGVGVTETVGAIERQGYGVDAIYVIGGPETPDGRVLTAVSLAQLVSSLGSEIEFVWLLHGDAVPRPDALAALVEETERSDASVVGSKILDAAQVDRLEFVGGSSDVFGEPYTGLDEAEVDLEQYDVVRDVAHVSAVSLLIRRDLMKGLQGLDQTLAPGSAGIDLSQRARLAGARVLIVPSSEVFHSSECRHDVKSWREQASRMRAMFKAYRLLTLAWVIPVGILISVFDGLARFGLRQYRPLFDYLRALVWNVLHLPSTISARRSLFKVRTTGDEELFRYQVAGSVRLRQLLSEYGARLGWIIDREPGVVEEDEPEDDWRAASMVVFAIVVLLVTAVTRRTLLPAGGSGMWLPFGSNPWSVLSGYAGGWNAAGLGSPEPVPPVVAVTALIQGVVFGWAGVQGLLTAASLVTAVWGVGRLSEELGVAGPSRFFGGLVYVIGPVALAVGGVGDWPAMLALGPLVWAVVWMVDEDLGFIARLGRLILAGLLAGSVIVSLPAWLVLIGAGLALVRRRLRILAWAVVAGLAGLGATASYLRAVSPPTLLAGGEVILWSWWVVGAGLVAAVLAIMAGSPEVWKPAAVGGVLAGVAVVLGIAPEVGWVVQSGGLLSGSLGLGLACAAAFSRDDEAGGGRRAVQILAATLAASVVVMSMPAALEGGWGIRPDDWTERLRFVGALSGQPEMERVLLVGEAGTLPGQVRAWGEAEYRLVNGDQIGLDEGFLPEPRSGDQVLSQALDGIASGASLHPGALLAPFAIRWIVLVGDTPLERGLQAQVDVRDVSETPEMLVMENLAYIPRVSAPGWEGEGGGFQGPPVDLVVLADNHDDGWVGTAEGWANRVPAVSGKIVYVPDPRGMALAYLAVTLLVASLAAIWWGRRR